MDNKFLDSINILKSNVEFVRYGEINTEEDFNTKVKWKTSEENGTAILTTTCPHSEITWTKVKAEMDKL
jgi:hypothetical protein